MFTISKSLLSKLGCKSLFSFVHPRNFGILDAHTIAAMLAVPENVSKKPDKQSFIRVHKSYIVSISKTEAIENNEIIIQSFRIPISRNYRDEVIDRLVNDRLWRK